MRSIDMRGPSLLNEGRRTALLLSEDLAQGDHAFYASRPRLGLESKPDVVLGNGGELEEVATDDELDAAKGLRGVPYNASNAFELVEKDCVHHGDYKNVNTRQD